MQLWLLRGTLIMAHQNNGYRIAILAALLGAGGLFAACSSDNNNPTPSNGDGGATGSGGGSSTGGSKASGGTPSSGGGANTGGANGGAGGASTGGGGGGGAGGASTGGVPADSGACTENATTACLECPNVPTTDVEFLNHCSPAGCIKFMGTVPATLPAIP
jgi:hypothetical protein